jgi:hypothetical protein
VPARSHDNQIAAIFGGNGQRGVGLLRTIHRDQNFVKHIASSHINVQTHGMVLLVQLQVTTAE